MKLKKPNKFVFLRVFNIIGNILRLILDYCFHSKNFQWESSYDKLYSLKSVYFFFDIVINFKQSEENFLHA